MVRPLVIAISPVNVPVPLTVPVLLIESVTVVPEIFTTWAPVAMLVPEAVIPIEMPVAEPTVTVAAPDVPVTVGVTVAATAHSSTMVAPEV